MAETVAKLKTELGKLSLEERAELAHFLIGSLDSQEDEGAEAAWDRELEKRAADIENGKVVGKPAEQVFAEIRKKYS
jgi:putative addiction module component (TIGR02574 family)